MNQPTAQNAQMEEVMKAHTQPTGSPVMNAPPDIITLYNLEFPLAHGNEKVAVTYNPQTLRVSVDGPNYLSVQIANMLSTVLKTVKVAPTPSQSTPKPSRSGKNKAKRARRKSRK